MQLQHSGWAGDRYFLTGFHGLADMPAEFQKAMDRTLNQSKNTFCFFDDILIVSKGSETEHEKLFTDVLVKLDDENPALKMPMCKCFTAEVNWLDKKSYPKAELRPKLQKRKPF